MAKARFGILCLQQVNTRNDPAVCDELVARLGELRASWSAIADGDAQEGKGPAPAPPGGGQGASVAA